MNNFWFSILIFGLISLGTLFGFALSAVNDLEIFKVLNVIGLFYDIVGLIILSEVLSQSEKFQKFIADIFSGLFMWAHMAVPIGIFLSGFILNYISEYPSAKITSGIGVGILFWMFIPSLVVEDIVFKAKTKRFQTPKERSRFLGGFLLLSGLLIQFIAAIKDLLA